MNPYEILGLKGNETYKQIKDAFKKMSLVHHPDKGGNVSKFIEVLNAYKHIIKSHQEYKDSEQKAAFNKLKKEYDFSASEEEEEHE